MLLPLVLGLRHVDSVVLVEAIFDYLLTLVAMSGAKSTDQV